MTQAFTAHIETRGGICDLSRVVGVMALLDLTPQRLTSSRDGSGLTIEAEFTAGRRDAELCLKRLKALASVRSASLLCA